MAREEWSEAVINYDDREIGCVPFRLSERMKEQFFKFLN